MKNPVIKMADSFIVSTCNCQGQYIVFDQINEKPIRFNVAFPEPGKIA